MWHDVRSMSKSDGSRKSLLLKLGKWAVLIGIVALIGIQFIPVPGLGENPEERFDIDAPPEVVAILRKACFDCHSNETTWPWYTRFAPGSWLLARDVRLGRENLNFSEWGDYDDEEMAYDKEVSWEQIEEGEMPPWFYVWPMHLDARLSEAELATLKAWMLEDAE